MNIIMRILIYVRTLSSVKQRDYGTADNNIAHETHYEYDFVRFTNLT